MSRKLVTLAAGMPILEAIRTLLRHEISGAPVVDEEGELVGLLSEFNCLKTLASGEFYEDLSYASLSVGDLMTRMSHTIPADLDIFAIADAFVTLRVRRLPVMEDGRLVGQVSRRDVLRAVERITQQHAHKRSYPDYPPGREPIVDYPETPPKRRG